jgi:NAD(P)-dependent dehydrogenase (short-subunit alcohol dehydrogenase family)
MRDGAGLDEKVTIVTRSSRGTGLPIAKGLVDDGACLHYGG